MQYLLTPYSQPIEPYAWWTGAFNDAELDWLQNQAKSASTNALVGGGGAGVVNPNIRRSQVNWISNTKDTTWVFEKLGHVASSLNSQFYNFELTGFGENLQLTHYDQSENGMYGWHVDYGGSGPSRKLSLVLQLSNPEDYEGGQLELKTALTPIQIEKQRGLIVAFPSYVLHQVTPVTKGTRQSLVAWVSGPRFK